MPPRRFWSIAGLIQGLENSKVDRNTTKRFWRISFTGYNILMYLDYTTFWLVSSSSPSGKMKEHNFY